MEAVNALKDAIARKQLPDVKLEGSTLVIGAFRFPRTTLTPIKTKTGFARLDLLWATALHHKEVGPYVTLCQTLGLPGWLDFVERPLIGSYLHGLPTTKEVVIDLAGLAAARASQQSAEAAAELEAANAPATATSSTSAIDSKSASDSSATAGAAPGSPTSKRHKSAADEAKRIESRTGGAVPTTLSEALALERAVHTRSSILQARSTNASVSGSGSGAAIKTALTDVLHIFDASRKGGLDGATLPGGSALAQSQASSAKVAAKIEKVSSGGAAGSSKKRSRTSSIGAPAGAGMPPMDAKTAAKYEESIPIILVPDAVSSLITIHNAREFFLHSTYTPSSSVDKRAAASTASTASTAAGAPPAPAAGGIKKDEIVSFERPSLRDPTKTVKYYIMDSVKKIKEMNAWKRVVAVFAHGAKWQFQDYPWPTPAQIFDNIAAYHLHFDDEPLNPNIKDWKVTKLKIKKAKRYEDRSTVMDFWQTLTDFISAHQAKKFLAF